MSYVDAIKSKEKILVVERNAKGQRVYREFPINYTFYYKDIRGKYQSIYGDPLSKVEPKSQQDFEKEKRMHSSKGLFESDINQVFRCLSDNYLGYEPPKLHVAYFDIETNFEDEVLAKTRGKKRGRGFAPINDPFNEITAITVYLDWLDQCITLAMPPEFMSDELAKELTEDFENCFLFRNEIELFNSFFDIIKDADVLTGWNSEIYDIPYLVNRCVKIMTKDDTKRFCLWDQTPKKKMISRFGKEQETYDLHGRVHLDYLQLYKKYNYESRHSYSLNAIGEMEVDELKTQYEGTLDQLYKEDFRTFIEYNRQDVMLMVKINDKLKFLDLANALAHENTVLLPTVMGSVSMIEMAIYNESHFRGMILPDRKEKVDFIEDTDEDVEEKAAGAYVAFPKKGLHEWVGSLDVNSLYPSAIRALNMSTETIIGQLRPTFTEEYIRQRKEELLRKRKRITEKTEITGPVIWEGLFGSLEYTSVMNKERGTMITIDYEDGTNEILSAYDIWNMIFNSGQKLILSANGTIFTYEKEGLIPGLLSRWYSERKTIQKQAKEAYGTEQYEYYDKRQLVKKILLNSASLGALV